MVLNLASQVLFSNVCDLAVDKVRFTKKIKAALVALTSGQRHLKYLQ